MANCAKTLFIFIFFITIYTPIILKAQTHKVILKGTTINRSSKVLYLLPYTSARVFYANKIEIPIKDNSFEYTLEVDTMLAYKFVFKDELDAGAYNPIVFFPDTNEVNFTLYNMDDVKKNIINGGKLNHFIKAFNRDKSLKFKFVEDEIASRKKILQDKNEYYSQYYVSQLYTFKKSISDYDKKIITKEEYYKNQNLFDKVQNSKESRTILGQKVELERDSLEREIISWKYEYLSKKVNLASYLLIYNDFNINTASNPFLIEKLSETVPLYEKVYPNHPYTTLIKDKLNGIIKIVKGNLLIDVLAMNIENEKEIKLLSLVKDKYTLIDLWGSWCGPCISKTKTMKPIYEKYKDSGFNIIGIAREFKSLKAVKNRIKIENYAWPNLYDLDDKYRIWDKYGIGNGTGLMILVDHTGKILAVDPTAEEVEKIISVN